MSFYRDVDVKCQSGRSTISRNQRGSHKALRPLSIEFLIQRRDTKLLHLPSERSPPTRLCSHYLCSPKESLEANMLLHLQLGTPPPRGVTMRSGQMEPGNLSVWSPNVELNLLFIFEKGLWCVFKQLRRNGVHGRLIMCFCLRTMKERFLCSRDGKWRQTKLCSSCSWCNARRVPRVSQCPSRDTAILRALHCPTAHTLASAAALPGWHLLALLSPLPGPAHLLVLPQPVCAPRQGWPSKHPFAQRVREGQKFAVLRKMGLSGTRLQFTCTGMLLTAFDQGFALQSRTHPEPTKLLKGFGTEGSLRLVEWKLPGITPLWASKPGGTAGSAPPGFRGYLFFTPSCTWENCAAFLPGSFILNLQEERGKNQMREHEDKSPACGNGGFKMKSFPLCTALH